MNKYMYTIYIHIYIHIYIYWPPVARCYSSVFEAQGRMIAKAAPGSAAAAGAAIAAASGEATPALATVRRDQ